MALFTENNGVSAVDLLRERRARQILNREDIAVNIAKKKEEKRRQFEKQNPFTAKSQKFTKRATKGLGRELNLRIRLLKEYLEGRQKL